MSDTLTGLPLANTSSLDEDLLVLDLHLVGAGLESVLLCIHQAGNSHKLKCRGIETNQDETQECKLERCFN